MTTTSEKPMLNASEVQKLLNKRHSLSKLCKHPRARLPEIESQVQELKDLVNKMLAVRKHHQSPARLARFGEWIARQSALENEIIQFVIVAVS